MPTAGTNRTLTAAAMYSLVLPAYAKKYGIDKTSYEWLSPKLLKKSLNGARNELAQFRREISAKGNL
ncbi:MAG: hypothetical protein Ct9H90mP11_00250 [Acidimicrobiales bacterium]|nr:MAG: hypothetical protein Ct9H90mP11_00250 [Acidimicrobiales bacterium]